jgi:hypothetical protein
MRTIKEKRRDLEINPLIDQEKLKTATDEEIEKIHKELFDALDKIMQDVIGESIYDDYY